MSITRENIVEATAKLVASYTTNILDYAPALSAMRHNFEPVLAMEGYSVNIHVARSKFREGHLLVKLSRAEAKFEVKDVGAMLDSGGLQNLALPAMLKVVSAIQDHLADIMLSWPDNGDLNRSILITRRLPQPLPGSGMVGQYVSSNNFEHRVLMGYSPRSLAQEFTIDVLYGIAVLS